MFVFVGVMWKYWRTVFMHVKMNLGFFIFIFSVCIISSFYYECDSHKFTHSNKQWSVEFNIRVKTNIFKFKFRLNKID